MSTCNGPSPFLLQLLNKSQDTNKYTTMFNFFHQTNWTNCTMKARINLKPPYFLEFFNKPHFNTPVPGPPSHF